MNFNVALFLWTHTPFGESWLSSTTKFCFFFRIFPIFRWDKMVEHLRSNWVGRQHRRTHLWYLQKCSFIISHWCPSVVLRVVWSSSPSPWRAPLSFYFCYSRYECLVEMQSTEHLRQTKNSRIKKSNASNSRKSRECAYVQILRTSVKHYKRQYITSMRNCRGNHRFHWSKTFSNHLGRIRLLRKTSFTTAKIVYGPCTMRPKPYVSTRFCCSSYGQGCDRIFQLSLYPYLKIAGEVSRPEYYLKISRQLLLEQRTQTTNRKWERFWVEEGN